MTNISITVLCNRSCSYCFARSLGEQLGHMGRDVFEKALAHLQRSGIKQARLLGGEPTIHPHFARFIDAIEDRDLDLLIFSNGRMPQKAIDRLIQFPRNRLSILMNVDPAEDQGEGVRQRFNMVCKEFGSSVILGLNIHSPGVELGFLLPIIDEYDLAPQIRLGLAHPCVGAENRFLHPRHYRSVGARIGAFAKKTRAQNIRLELDCGFVPCMFSEEDLDLIRESGGEIPGNRCNPLPDYLPDGRFIPCYPLAKVASLADGEESLGTLVQATFTDRLTALRRAGVFKLCDGCSLLRANLCNGGCLAAAIQRRRHIPFSLPASARPQIDKDLPDDNQGPQNITWNAEPEVDTTSPKLLPWAIPYIDQPLAFWQTIADRFGPQIGEVYLPLPGTLLPSGRPVQKTRFLDDFLRRPLLPVGILLNPVILPQPVESIAPAIIEALCRLLDTIDLKNVTVANFSLAARIKEALPELPLTASVLMDIATPQQAMLIQGICNRLVPSSRIMRNHQRLAAIRQAFSGEIRMMVNESCLPDCHFRAQHFYEMAYSTEPPQSLCLELLDHTPWLRLTGAWVLPQHLHLFSDVVDEMKLAGRVTLQEPGKYLHVLDAYLTGKELTPDVIGGGPASLLHQVTISEDFYRATLFCDKQCHNCTVCKDYLDRSERG